MSGTFRRGSMATWCAVLAARAMSVHAGTSATWNSPVDGSWSDAAKWSSNPNYPNNNSPAGTTYDVSINAGGTYALTQDVPLTLDSLTIANAGATLWQNSALTVANSIDVQAGTLRLSN